ncbi:4Fe-4S dicluster domain-containing protein [Collibacillus ludicampi]|uniref:4Fe-4S dicluster domain-containing protein n=1 Tax=Collibacillus ludicampi TaxID=2771369 RepID=UPI0034E2C88F
MIHLVEILDICPGCGKCVRKGVCPTDAITIQKGKAVIGQGCIDCGLCIPVCPIGVIVKTEPEAKSIVQVERKEEEHAAE